VASDCFSVVKNMKTGDFLAYYHIIMEIGGRCKSFWEIGVVLLLLFCVKVGIVHKSDACFAS
jgi:hypothetical protein